ncbi:hypothetical protein PPERSA_06643 [Pseudocohnilembus persalinus]|uniref:Uncharacterized protein n=1 Tax=Pseudocohnilembus persalinus TaxID=266149 RepID=A0A0V0QS38_PSEPJ|nr:hypothetical protein PPERSA_06643 [Pseudocohnilembus persalinus]|eukprot:KRX05009.1 hypothetical protein PPERSA_06643 [Pseudocohnilembus persalinus]
MSEKEVEFDKEQQNMEKNQKKFDEDLNERLQENQQQKQLNDNKQENEQNNVEENNNQCYNNDSNQVLETFNANNINNNLNLQLQQDSDDIQQNRSNSEYLLSQKNAILGVLGQNSNSSNLQNNFQERQNRISNRLEQKFQSLFEKIENKSPQKKDINNKKEFKSFQSPIRKQDKQEQKSSNYKQFSNNNKNALNLNDLAQNYNQQSNKILKEKILKQNDIINEAKQNTTLQFQFSPNKKNFRVENQDTINSQYSNKKEENSDKKQEDLAKKSNLQILLLKSKNQQLCQQSQQFNEDSYRSPLKFTSTKKLGDFSSPKVDLQKQINNEENYAYLKQQQQQNNGHQSNISKLSQQKSLSNYQQKSPSFLEKSKIYSAQRLFTGNSSGNKQMSENNDFLSQSRNLNLIQLNSKLSSEKKNQEYIFQSDLEKKNLFDEVQEHIFERKNNFAQKKLDLNIKIDSINNKDIQRDNIFFPNYANNQSRNNSQKNQVKSQIHLKKSSQYIKNNQNTKDLSSFSKNYTPNSNRGIILERKKSSISQNKGLNINNYHQINNNNSFLSPQRICESEKNNEQIFRNRNKSTSYEITVVSSTGQVIQNDNYQVKEKDGKISLKEFMIKKAENFQKRSFGNVLNENQNNQFANNLKDLIAEIWQKSDRNQKINNNNIKESNQVQTNVNFVKNQNSPIKLINKKSSQNMKNQESYGFNNQWDNVVKNFGHTNGDRQISPKRISFVDGFKVKTKNLEKYERDFNNYRNISYNNSFSSANNLSPSRLYTNTSKF